jgi:2-keto-4-pentenoate hydratase
MEDAAALLYSIRSGQHLRVAALPAELAPADEAAAYRTQNSVLQKLGAGIGGWKASMPDAQRGTSAPIATGNVLRSPALISDLAHRTANTQRFGVEPEIAFTFKHSLPPLDGDEKYSRNQVLSAVAAAHSALEICVCRLQDFDAAPPLHRLADSIMNEGLLLGGGVAGWSKLDLTQRRMVLQINGQTVHEGIGGHPIGDPVIPLVWIANHLSARGIGLKAGDAVTTGSFAGIHTVDAGQKARVEFEGLGIATITF